MLNYTVFKTLENSIRHVAHLLVSHRLMPSSIPGVESVAIAVLFIHIFMVVDPKGEEGMQLGTLMLVKYLQCIQMLIEGW